MIEPAERLLGTLQGAGDSRRVPLGRILEAFEAAFPHHRGSPRGREELAFLLEALAREGRVQLPKSERLHDRSQKPPLPSWVVLPGPAPKMTPLRQARELASGRLFGPQRLSYALLRCRPVHVPCVFREFGSGGEGLIIENKDTFQSACEAVASLGPRSPLRWVVFGAGNGIAQSVASLQDWPVRPTRLRYFGDLDAPGLQIAVRATAEAARLAPPLPVEPAASLYAALMEKGRRAALTLTSGRAIAGNEIEPLLAWLPVDMRAAGGEVLLAGRRWPQELLTRADLIRALTSATAS